MTWNMSREEYIGPTHHYTSTHRFNALLHHTRIPRTNATHTDLTHHHSTHHYTQIPHTTTPHADPTHHYTTTRGSHAPLHHHTQISRTTTPPHSDSTHHYTTTLGSHAYLARVPHSSSRRRSASLKSKSSAMLAAMWEGWVDLGRTPGRGRGVLII